MPIIGRQIGAYDQAPIVSREFLRPKYRRKPTMMLEPYQAAANRIATSVSILGTVEIVAHTEAAKRVLNGKRFDDILQRSMGTHAWLKWATASLFEEGRAYLKVIYDKDTPQPDGADHFAVLSEIDVVDPRYILHIGSRAYFFVRSWSVDRKAVASFYPQLAPFLGRLCPIDRQHFLRLDLADVLSKTEIKARNVKEARRLGARSFKTKNRTMGLRQKSFTDELANLRRHLALTIKPLSKYEIEEVVVSLLLGTLPLNGLYNHATEYYLVRAFLQEKLNAFAIRSAILDKLADGLSSSASAVTGQECVFTFKSFDQTQLQNIESFPVEEFLYKNIDTWENLDKRAALAVEAIDLMSRNIRS